MANNVQLRARPVAICGHIWPGVRKYNHIQSKMLMIRLARFGAKKVPFYRIVLTEKASARDSGFVEELGFFDQLGRNGDDSLRINVDSLEKRISQGAQMSPRVASLLKRYKKEQIEQAAAAIEAAKKAKEKAAKAAKKAAEKAKQPQKTDDDGAASGGAGAKSASASKSGSGAKSGAPTNKTKSAPASSSAAAKSAGRPAAKSATGNKSKTRPGGSASSAQSPKARDAGKSTNSTKTGAAQSTDKS